MSQDNTVEEGMTFWGSLRFIGLMVIQVAALTSLVRMVLGADAQPDQSALYEALGHAPPTLWDSAEPFVLIAVALGVTAMVQQLFGRMRPLPMLLVSSGVAIMLSSIPDVTWFWGISGTFVIVVAAAWGTGTYRLKNRLSKN